jgi:hypothetical protein
MSVLMDISNCLNFGTYQDARYVREKKGGMIVYEVSFTGCST